MTNTSPIVINPNDTRIYNGDRVYLQKGEWKCWKSPTGAHYWLLNETYGHCKYCYKTCKAEEQTVESAWSFYLMTNWDDYYASYQQAKKRIIGGADVQ